MPEVIDSKVIDKIVAEVLGQIRGRTGSLRSETNGSAKNETKNGTPIELTEAVITAELLKQNVRKGGEVSVAAKAILTPSARDFLKENKISLTNGRSAPVGNKQLQKAKGAIVAAHLPAVVQDLMGYVKKQAASAWAVQTESGTPQVVDTIRSMICRGEFPQVVAFVKTAHEVACLVNRNDQCQAAVVRRDADVRSVRQEMAANVICVDLAQPTLFGLRNILKASEDTIGQLAIVEAKP